MLTDPQVLTVNSVAKSMPRVETNGRKSVYQTDDSLFSQTISHRTTSAGRVQSLYATEQRGLVTSPIDSSVDYDSVKINVTIDRPGYGFTVTQIQQLMAAIKANLTDSLVAQLFGQQS